MKLTRLEVWSGGWVGERGGGGANVHAKRGEWERVNGRERVCVWPGVLEIKSEESAEGEDYLWWILLVCWDLGEWWVNWWVNWWDSSGRVSHSSDCEGEGEKEGKSIWGGGSNGGEGRVKEAVSMQTEVVKVEGCVCVSRWGRGRWERKEGGEGADELPKRLLRTNIDFSLKRRTKCRPEETGNLPLSLSRSLSLESHPSLTFKRLALFPTLSSSFPSKLLWFTRFDLFSLVI